ncbi:hypothetical protein ABN763_06190 [Spongiivirga sp. MCCC 1A20706]|uniref:hypothetical protein n=1 Tax=Spongiivirga sp. MCCC 1A20706 TaxID=3160963 RepID=UPI003977C9F7
MKNLLKLFFFLFVITFSYGQKTFAHVSFNCYEEKDGRIINNGLTTEFFSQGQHFISETKPLEITHSVIEDNNILTIKDFLNLASKERLKRQKKNVANIIFNDQVFKSIYLYCYDNGKFYKYQVKWVEEISD